MATGSIKRLVRDRGFGFIRDEAGDEFFFHRSGVSGVRFEQLTEGDRVEFELDAKGTKGPRAHQVTKV